MFEELKNFAKENKVPIIQDEGLNFIIEQIHQNKIKDALEIGTAIGYSALSIASFGVKVDTIERDSKIYEEALKNVSLYDKDRRINLIFHDALTYENISKTYDLIFIDAAKGQYMKFFDKYSKYLNRNGIIICDNLNFHDLKPEEVSRNTRQLLKKIDLFKKYLKEHETFETTFYNVGDGMSVSRLK